MLIVAGVAGDLVGEGQLGASAAVSGKDGRLFRRGMGLPGYGQSGGGDADDRDV